MLAKITGFIVALFASFGQPLVAHNSPPPLLTASALTAVELSTTSRSIVIPTSAPVAPAEKKNATLDSRKISTNYDLLFSAFATSISGKIDALIASSTDGAPSDQSQIAALQRQVSLLNRIDSLSNVSISSPSISGGTLSGGSGSFTSISSSGGLSVAGPSDFDSGTLFVDSSTHRVGVGTTSPADSFALNGALYLSSIAVPVQTGNRLYSSSGSLYWDGSLIGSTSLGSWTASGADVYRSSGNVGIGTNNPTLPLDIAGTGNLVNIGNGNASQSAYADFGAGRAFFGYNGATSNAVVQAITSKGIEFNVNNGTFGAGTVAVITSLGQVGIGTTTPGSLLSLADIANFTTATSTFYSTGGVNLAAGCFAIAGNCLSLLNLSGTLGVSSGGTGASTLGQGWIFSNGGTGALAASTSPTVNYITATSTAATSTLAGGLSVAGLAGLTVLQSGKVGISTASPITNLHINANGGSLYVGDTTNTSASLSFNGRAQFGLDGSSGAAYIQGSSGKGVNFIVNPRIERQDCQLCS